MSWIQALGGIASLIGGASGASSGRGMIRRGQGMQDQAVGNAGDLYRRALQNFNDREAQGAYNADATLKLLSEMAASNLNKTDKNTAGQLATLGYRRGDSPFTQKAAQNSEAANFKLRSDLLNTQQMFNQQKNNDLGFVSGIGNQYNNLLTGIGGQNIDQGQKQAAAGYGSIGNLIGNNGLDINWDFLKKSNPNAKYGPFEYK
jgi:hypothetical protein